jgi:glycosyltransferase involved in cell wall biosynthesis
MSKVAFVISGKSPLTIPGGLGAYSYNVSRILNSLGYRVFILGFSDREENVDLGFATLVHFVNRYARLLGLGSIPAAPLFVARMTAIIGRLRPRQVVVYSAGIWGIAGTRLKKKFSQTDIQVKTLVGYFTTFRHEYRGHIAGAPAADYGLVQAAKFRLVYVLARALYSPVERRMLAHTDRVVVHYDSTRAILLSEFPRLRPERVVKAPYYVELYERESAVEAAEQMVSTDGIPNVTVLCRQDPRKGINTFLKAARILRDRGRPFHCVVAGSGVFLKQNKRLAAKLGLDDLVKFPGFVDSADTLFDQSDIYVLPSVEEGSGAISLLEAMKKGIAILTTLCDGIPEDLVDDETALLVPPGDHEAMAAALQRLVEDQGLRKRLAENVRRDYGRRFTFDLMRSGLQGVLDSIHAETQGRSGSLRSVHPEA